MQQKSFQVVSIIATSKNTKHQFEVWVRLANPMLKTRIKLSHLYIQAPDSNESGLMYFPGGSVSWTTNIGGYEHRHEYSIRTEIVKSVYDKLLQNGVQVRFHISDVSKDAKEYNEKFEATLTNGLWKKQIIYGGINND